MTRRKDWLVAAPAAILAVCWWVIETLAPNLIPLPPRLAWAAIGACAVAAILIFAVRGFLYVRQRQPGPWIARPFWRTARWVRERPRLSILLAVPSATFGISVLETLTVSLTIHRQVAAGRRPSVISFEDAMLTLVQQHRGQRRVWRLRPVESGGFLSLPIPPGGSDSILVVFALMATPLASAHAPDLNRPYSLVLDRVHGTLLGRRPVIGRLPSEEWRSPDLI